MQAFDTLYRRVVLSVADAPPVGAFVRQQGRKLGVSRFVAGETLPEVLAATRALRQDGIESILDLLGEFVDTEVKPGVTYEYYLVDIETSGKQTWHGPVSARVPIRPAVVPDMRTRPRTKDGPERLGITLGIPLLWPML